MYDSGVICGATTNPTLIAREGREFGETIREILDIFGDEALDQITVFLGMLLGRPHGFPGHNIVLYMKSFQAIKKGSYNANQLIRILFIFQHGMIYFLIQQNRPNTEMTTTMWIGLHPMPTMHLFRKL